MRSRLHFADNFIYLLDSPSRKNNQIYQSDTNRGLRSNQAHAPFYSHRNRCNVLECKNKFAFTDVRFAKRVEKLAILCYNIKDG